ncbi:MAG: hypothetical protein WBM78_16095 [Desulfobacterales bacterium]
MQNKSNSAVAGPVFSYSEPENYLRGLGSGQLLDAASRMVSITPYPQCGIQRSTDETGDTEVPEATTTEADPEQTETAVHTGLYTQSTGSMLELIVRKTPQDGVLCEAELTIRMDYIFVTAGTGELGTELFDPQQVHNLYALGDTSIEMSRLPSPKAASQQLSDQHAGNVRKGRNF